MMVEGFLEKLIQDNSLFYHSKVSKNYSHLTDAGQESVNKFMCYILPLLSEILEQELEQKSKEYTLNCLKE